MLHDLITPRKPRYLKILRSFKVVSSLFLHCVSNFIDSIHACIHFKYVHADRNKIIHACMVWWWFGKKLKSIVTVRLVQPMIFIVVCMENISFSHVHIFSRIHIILLKKQFVSISLRTYQTILKTFIGPYSTDTYIRHCVKLRSVLLTKEVSMGVYFFCIYELVKLCSKPQTTPFSVSK